MSLRVEKEASTASTAEWLTFFREMLELSMRAKSAAAHDGAIERPHWILRIYATKGHALVGELHFHRQRNRIG